MSLLIEWNLMKKAHDMTDREVLDALDTKDIRAKIRFAFSAWSGRIQQAQWLPEGLPPIELRRMELEAAETFMEIMRLAI